MYVDFSFCFFYHIKAYFSITEYIFGRTQAFTNPTDLASSGVWENVYLGNTPTFDGVCGIIIFIILFVLTYL